MNVEEGVETLAGCFIRWSFLNKTTSVSQGNLLSKIRDLQFGEEIDLKDRERI